MASRVPIVAARNSSIPEVTGEEAAIFFDPLSVGELKTNMEKLLLSQELGQRLVRAGQERLRRFDWRNSALKTVNVYESVLGSN